MQTPQLSSFCKLPSSKRFSSAIRTCSVSTYTDVLESEITNDWDSIERAANLSLDSTVGTTSTEHSWTSFSIKLDAQWLGSNWLKLVSSTGKSPLFPFTIPPSTDPCTDSESSNGTLSELQITIKLSSTVLSFCTTKFIFLLTDFVGTEVLILPTSALPNEALLGFASFLSREWPIGSTTTGFAFLAFFSFVPNLLGNNFAIGPDVALALLGVWDSVRHWILSISSLEQTDLQLVDTTFLMASIKTELTILWTCRLTNSPSNSLSSWINCLASLFPVAGFEICFETFITASVAAITLGFNFKFGCFELLLLDLLIEMLLLELNELFSIAHRSAFSDAVFTADWTTDLATWWICFLLNFISLIFFSFVTGCTGIVLLSIWTFAIIACSLSAYDNFSIESDTSAESISGSDFTGDNFRLDFDFKSNKVSATAWISGICFDNSDLFNILSFFRSWVLCRDSSGEINRFFLDFLGIISTPLTVLDILSLAFKLDDKFTIWHKYGECNSESEVDSCIST